MDYDTTEQSLILRKIMIHLGLWLGERKSKYHLPQVVISLLIHLPFTFTLTILMWLDVIFSVDLNDAMDVLYIALTETALVVKILSMWIHMDLVKSLFQQWQSDESFQLRTIQEKIMWRRTFKGFGRVVFVYITISVSVVLCSFSSVIFLETRQLPFRYWTPFDRRNPLYFWYAYVYEFFAMPLTCLSNCSLDLFHCFLMQYPAMCFASIAMRLENLGSKKSQSDLEIKRELLQIISFDQKVRRMCRQCEKIISYPIMGQILLSALVLCFSLYRLQNVSFLEDPGSFTGLWQYAIVMTLQIYLPCYYANELTVHSSRPLGSVFNSNWPKMSIGNRKIILTYMHFLNRPVILRAGNFLKWVYPYSARQ